MSLKDTLNLIASSSKSASLCKFGGIYVGMDKDTKDALRGNSDDRGSFGGHWDHRGSFGGNLAARDFSRNLKIFKTLGFCDFPDGVF